MGDPHDSARYPDSQKYLDLLAADRAIFEDVLAASGQEGEVGFAEATVTLKNGIDFYQFPYGFRQFKELVYVVDGRVYDYFRSKPYFSTSWGALIFSGTRGFRIFPAPILNADQDWTLRYLRGPAPVHYAKAKSVLDNSLTFGTPGTNAGEVFLLPDFYNGCEIRIYRASKGAGQVREVLKFVTKGSEGTCILKHPWDMKPEGDVYYEICPTVSDWALDSLYAVDAALMRLSGRDRPDKKASLTVDRAKLWEPVRSYFSSNTSDRGPARTTPIKPIDLLPCGEI